jgi:hypothetical protein
MEKKYNVETQSCNHVTNPHILPRLTSIEMRYTSLRISVTYRSIDEMAVAGTSDLQISII